jgi:diguanylate cyclase (GGDEF)-like protein
MTGLRVLLLEDSLSYSELVQAQLEDTLPEAGVVGTTTLAAALEALVREPWDVVLADLSLPDADGLDVVRRLHAVCRDTALVVLTGRSDGGLALEALSAGAQEYLVKGADDGSRLATVVRHAVQRSRTEQEARRYERLARSLLDALEAPTCAVDRTSRIVAVNAAWDAFALAGGSDPSAVGVDACYLDVCDAVPVTSSDRATADAVATGLRDVLSGRSDRCAVDYPCPSPQEQRWFSVRIAAADVDGGRGAVLTHVDVSEMQRTQQALTHQALHHALTGLPNRLLLTDRLSQALADSDRRSSTLAVAFLDVDHFKRVNDSLGHPAGDALLRAVGRRLRVHLRSGDTLGRFSGDEFVVVWRDLGSAGEAETLAQRMCEALSEPFDLGTATVTVSASIGVAVGSAPQTAEELLLAADAAMYDAKGHGRGRVRLFSSELRRGASERMETELGLRRALENDELVLHYQPVVERATGRPVAVEALVRWQHPERGLLPPDSFIPVAESSGLIVPLGRWVLEKACLEAASWPSDLDVAVNLSVRQLTQPDVLAHVRQALQHSGLPPERLLLEVTESAVMEDAEAAGDALDAMARLGVRIAVDDFGTGYSSLLYLRRYPIRALKVDRAFVGGMTETPDDAAIVSSVISLAKAVGATSIAEGVETPEQYAALRSIGCEQAQGYLWSRPVPAEQLPAALAACARVDVPLPGRPSRPAGPALDAEVGRKINLLHAEGASLHTIAAALNKIGAPNPAGVRWHAHAVARHVASAGPAR